MTNPITILRSLLFYVAYYIGTALLVIFATPVSKIGERYVSPMIAGWARFHHLCVIYLLGIRVEVRGELPRDGVLIAMKHESFFEALELPYLFSRPVAFAKAELLRIPIWGPLGRANGLIPVEREQGARTLRTMLQAVKSYVGKGRVIVIFPEGTRVPHGTEPPLLAGFAAVYKTLKIPVVPIAVNSGPLYHRRWKKRGTIVFSVCDPIEPGLPRAEIEARVHKAINHLNE
ncbi:MAG: 1-acyl-sn-glycerol-3-phosphate acyltransferase [Novosphingobium sp.]|nr:1-acyl-sn-glycerol-3-phosphate acyltransferase [Novosphingobium sp.]